MSLPSQVDPRYPAGACERQQSRQRVLKGRLDAPLNGRKGVDNTVRDARWDANIVQGALSFDKLVILVKEVLSLNKQLGMDIFLVGKLGDGTIDSKDPLNGFRKIG